MVAKRRIAMNLTKKLFLTAAVLMTALLLPLHTRAADISASGFSIFQQDGKTKGRVTLSGDFLGGIPEIDLLEVRAYQLDPGGVPPFMEPFYLSYYCPLSLSIGHGTCMSDEQLNGYLCQSTTLWQKTHRTNSDIGEHADTAPFNYQAEFDIPDSLFGSNRVILTGRLFHQWGGPYANWSAAVYMHDIFFDGKLECKRDPATETKSLHFEQVYSPDGGLSTKTEPFSGLSFSVDCGSGKEHMSADADGVLSLDVGACGCKVSVCDGRVANDYSWTITKDSATTAYSIVNDEKNADGLKGFADQKYMDAIHAVGVMNNISSNLPDHLVNSALEQRTPVQQFKSHMDFYDAYMEEVRRLRKKLLLQKKKCGQEAAASASQSGVDVVTGAVESIAAALNIGHKTAAVGPAVQADTQAPYDGSTLTVTPGDKDVVVTTMQDMVQQKLQTVRVKLKAGHVDIHSTAVMTPDESGGYWISVLDGLAIVFNASGVPFKPFIGSGTYGHISAAGDLTEVGRGVGTLPASLDGTMEIVTESSTGRMNGSADALRIFNDFRNSAETGKGLISYEDNGLSIAGNETTMRPVSFNYDGRIQIEVATPIFNEPVDLYFGLFAEPYNLLLLLDRAGRWTTALTPWKKNVKTVGFETVLPSIDGSMLEPGDYKAYLVALPTGQTDFSEMTAWEAVLHITHEAETVELDNSIYWEPSDGIGLISAHSSGTDYSTAVADPCGTDVEFVRSLYQSILERDLEVSSEPGHGAAHLQSLQDGATRASLIVAFFDSPEYQNKQKSDDEFIRDAYQAILGREPTSAEQSVSIIFGRDDFLNSLFLSSEYRDMMAACGQGASSADQDKTVTINSMHDYSYSFVREEITSKPDFDNEYDLMAEPWCTVKPALCGNFLPVIVLDVPDPDFDIIDSIPESGYLSDESGFENCIEVEEQQIYINKNRDGTHTAFKIVEHSKPSDCEHTIRILYRNLD